MKYVVNTPYSNGSYLEFLFSKIFLLFLFSINLTLFTIFLIKYFLPIGILNQQLDIVKFWVPAFLPND